MSDFERHSGVVYSQGPDPRYQEETARQELEERINRMRHEHANAEHDRKEAALQARITEATDVSLKGNGYYQSLVRGDSLQTVAMTEGEKRTAAAAAASPNAFNQAPKALVDNLAVTIGGINIGPKEAQGMLARGEISRTDYAAAVNVEVAKYGYSFK